MDIKRNLRAIAIILFFTLFVLYGGFEMVKVFLGPSLTITSPKDLDTSEVNLIDVTGNVARVSYITLNDRQIFADTSGHFDEKLLLLPGYNIITVKVKDRFGKEKQQILHIWYTEPPATKQKQQTSTSTIINNK